MSRVDDIDTVFDLKSDVHTMLAKDALDEETCRLVDALMMGMSVGELLVFRDRVKIAVLAFREEVVSLAIPADAAGLLQQLGHVCTDQLPSREDIYDLTENGITHACNVESWQSCSAEDRRQDRELDHFVTGCTWAAEIDRDLRVAAWEQQQRDAMTADELRAAVVSNLTSQRVLDPVSRQLQELYGPDH